MNLAQDPKTAKRRIESIKLQDTNAIFEEESEHFHLEVVFKDLEHVVFEVPVELNFHNAEQEAQKVERIHHLTPVDTVRYALVLGDTVGLRQVARPVRDSEFNLQSFLRDRAILE